MHVGPKLRCGANESRWRVSSDQKSTSDLLSALAGLKWVEYGGFIGDHLSDAGKLFLGHIIWGKGLQYDLPA